MKAELVPMDGGPPIPITRDLSVIGRREYCDVQIDHPSLSKRHAVLVKTDGLLILRDLVSTNGTKVKGQRIRWAALLPEDRISFGALKFRVYLGPDHLPSPSESAVVAKPAGRPAAAKFDAPSPLGTPVVNASRRPGANQGANDSDDWRTAISARPASPEPAFVLNDHDLILEDDEDIVDLDDVIIDLD